MKPALPEFDCSGTRSRAVSSIMPSRISAEPNGTAVCDTFSRTSYTMKRTIEFLWRPSQARNKIVHKNCGFEHLCAEKRKFQSSIHLSSLSVYSPRSLPCDSSESSWHDSVQIFVQQLTDLAAAHVRHTANCHKKLLIRILESPIYLNSEKNRSENERN